ncbi:hippocampus abundant transcript-like protein 1 [Cynocephalus volans]|uniref:hippocampus abundant transcript-like protein 1 n=1 Tax=Cynocephalus volans TaxID=110931 RepID=UPI002FCC1503
MVAGVVGSSCRTSQEASLQGFGRPSVHHAAVVIFLEFFAWDLLTTPMLTVLHETFPQHTFLMNGLIQGVKGLLSFLSAPLVGALSDVWGRKSFLLATVFFTCFPIPLMRISPWWYFAMISVSGVFSVTFSVIFAYVADVTQEHERSTAYGWVSATFAASLVSSPAIGAYLSASYGDSLVVLVATVVALLDICFILLAVPESLPEKMRPVSRGAQISWKQADPFSSLKKVGKDSTVLLICITVFLSYLPEAGQYSSFFLYLRQVIGFGSVKIAAFIATVGILSIVAQAQLSSPLRWPSLLPEQNAPQTSEGGCHLLVLPQALCMCEALQCCCSLSVATSRVLLAHRGSQQGCTLPGILSSRSPSPGQGWSDLPPGLVRLRFPKALVALQPAQQAGRRGGRGAGSSGREQEARPGNPEQASGKVARRPLAASIVFHCGP